MKRILVVLVALILFAAPGPASDSEAQMAAVSASQAWLEVVDAGKYGKSWDAAAALFRRALTKAQWEAALAKARGPLGKVVSRSLRGSQLTRELPGAPPGEYVVIQYATDFENRKGATETVTPMKESDGTWRVSGYYIK